MSDLLDERKSEIYDDVEFNDIYHYFITMYEYFLAHIIITLGTVWDVWYRLMKSNPQRYIILILHISSHVCALIEVHLSKFLRSQTTKFFVHWPIGLLALF